LFQVFQNYHISANLSQEFIINQIYSKYILNPNKLDTSNKYVKLKQKFDLFIIKYFFDTFDNIHQKMNSYFEYTITSFF